MPVPVIGIHSMETCESGSYYESDTIMWRLDQISQDSQTQHKQNETEILNRLVAGHYDTQIRMDIGDHVNTPLAVVLKLTEDENTDVRFGLAENHNLHASALNLLAEDSNPFVAQRAQKTLARLAGSAADIVHAKDKIGIVRCAFPNALGRRLKGYYRGC